ncbi:MAG: hypothetical protein IJG84_23550 [Kiritimatiellae bacterium]|nr:hypothetical protein [Kiritimatiellia bacterium]
MTYDFEHSAVVMMGELTVDNGDIALADVETVLYEQEVMLSVLRYKREIAIWTYDGDDAGMAERPFEFHGSGAERHRVVRLRMRSEEGRRGDGNRESQRFHSPSGA